MPPWDVLSCTTLYEKCGRDMHSQCGFCHATVKRGGKLISVPPPNELGLQALNKHSKTYTHTYTKNQPNPPNNPKISQIETENIFAQVLLHLVHPVTFTVTEHLLKSCIFNVYFNTFWLASLYRIAPWQECVYVCASDLMLFFLVISKGV